jgi:hypothetical protein
MDGLGPVPVGGRATPCAVIIMCCPSTAGILYACPLNGVWSSTETWPAAILSDTRRIVICASGEIDSLQMLHLPPDLAARAGFVQLRDFLLLSGAADTIHAITSPQTPRDVAWRALIKNRALIERYQRAGPYETIQFIPTPPDLCQKINRDTAARMAGYTPQSVSDKVRSQLRNLPNHAIFLDMAWQSDAAIAEIVALAGRKVKGDFILPAFVPTDIPGDLELEIRMRAAGKLLTILEDGAARPFLEDALQSAYPDLCRRAGGPSRFFDMVCVSLTS